MSAPSFARAAGLIAGLTVVARVVGFGRIFVFSWAVGLTTLGTIYQTINTLPNIVFEIVAGGALSAAVVPLISAALTRRRSADVDQLASALLTWSIVILAPLALLVAAFARPIATALLGSDTPSDHIALGARFLVVFAPQLVLYGVGIVLTGILQAHHRFAWPAVAPMLSSLTVMAAYVWFALSAGRGADVDSISREQELILSVGTTAAVAVLTLCLLFPLRGAGVKLRPTLRLPAGAGRSVRALVGSGVATVGAQQLTLLAVLVLLQPPAPEGAVPAFNLAYTVFLLPWAVLAVPVATSVFPRLAAAHAADDHPAFHRTLTTATRVTLLLTAAAAAVLIAAATPMAEVITAVAAGRKSTDEIAAAIALFGPGLIGYGLLALLSRALYAAGVAGATAAVTVGGWAVVLVADIALALAGPADARVVAVALGNSIGMTVLGIALVWLVRRGIGSDALAGTGRDALCAVGAAGLAAAVGWSLTLILPEVSGLLAVGSGLIVALATTVVFAAVVLLVDRDAALTVVGVVRRRFGRGQRVRAGE